MDESQLWYWAKEAEHKRTHPVRFHVCEVDQLQDKTQLWKCIFGGRQSEEQGCHYLQCQGEGRLWWRMRVSEKEDRVVPGVLTMFYFCLAKHWLHECLLCGNSPRCILLVCKLFLNVCVLFHTKNANKKKMHGKPLAQCEFSLNKVVVGSVSISFGDASWELQN